MSTTLRNRHGGLRGFTLVELMMVVVIVSIVASMALPGISNARRRSNEASAIASLRLISSAQSQHRVRFGSFNTIAGLEGVGYLDENFEDGAKAGYAFTDAVAPTPGVWAVRAEPLTPGASGDRFFFIDTSGVIRYADGQSATATDPPVE
jgi:prepilin-type N-terminal cleavage/methylation domain-containing protein